MRHTDSRKNLNAAAGKRLSERFMTTLKSILAAICAAVALNAAQATHVEASGLSLDPGAWQLGARDGSANANNALMATVRCADMPPLR